MWKGADLPATLGDLGDPDREEVGWFGSHRVWQGGVEFIQVQLKAGETH
jgi:hypothetical protein